MKTSGEYCELIIDGDEKSIRAYLEGLFEGKRIRRGYFFCKDHDIESHHLDLFEFLHERTHILLRCDLLDRLKPALENAPEYMKLKVLAEKPVQALSFELEFDAKNAEVAGRIKKALKSIPPGVRLEEFEEREERDPGARGVEGYAPMPEYRYRGKGRASGDVEGVLKLRHKLSEIEFVDMDEVKVVYRNRRE